MKSKISNQFMINYIIVFILSIIVTLFALLAMSFASRLISKALVKNIYTAEELMQEDYSRIDAEAVVLNGGGVQVVDKGYRVVYSRGLKIFDTQQLTVRDFTDFLVYSKSKDMPYHHDILYNQQQNFWLIVSFPTSVRMDFSLVYNKEVASKDMKNVSGVIIAIIILYLLLLALFSLILSRITSMGITKPLRKLRDAAKGLREGDYSTRVDLKLKNEFAELQDTFNEMAEKIEGETAMRKEAEEARKRLILDLSHDLKNPLSSIIGYTELCLKDPEAFGTKEAGYLEIIYKNSKRAGELMNDLFEFSRLENPEFKLKLKEIELCEYIRQVCGEILLMLESAGFSYNFNIPDCRSYVLMDTIQMNRVFYNIVDNAIRYNKEGTNIHIELNVEAKDYEIVIADNGIGIPENMAREILKPFVRGDNSRNSNTGGSGLGLSIANKIVEAHGGSLLFTSSTDRGCSLTIRLPRFRLD